MAKLCVLCGSLCVYFLLFLRITAVLSISDYALYDVKELHPNSGHWVDIQLLQDVHNVQKRDIPIGPGQGIQDNRSNPPPSTDVSVPIPPPKMKATKTPKIFNSTKPVLLKVPLQKNLLGVNGTGQRKDVTGKPVLLPETTLAPILHNDTLASTSNQTEDDAEDFSIAKFDKNPEDLNNTLAIHNITITRTDSHLYYNSTMSSDPEMAQSFWVDLSNRTDVKVNELLSKSHRRAATVKLSFEFPFYGHLIKNVTIATGGFLYTGDYVHSWLAATQYIAPLMANFDTSISNESYIRYYDNGTALTVEWEKVSLQDKPDKGEFTFQATLHKNGDILFVYQTVPSFIKDIVDDHHPVKVGLSDAYIIDRTIFFVRRKTIYEYHRVNFQKEHISNWTVIYLKALPTCLDSKDCTTCLTRKIQNFKCLWCPHSGRCSNGVDRNRQDWIMKGCDKKQFSNETMCSSHIVGSDIFNASDTTYSHDENEFLQHQLEDHSQASRIYDSSALGPNQPVKMGVSGIVAILFLIAMVAGLGVWILYAYRNPHTTSGQILIRYRPSQWRWRRGEARYTAATIHM